jgi:hypothetical protein
MKSDLQFHLRRNLAPLNRIRVETALSRYPIHRLSKKTAMVINIETEGGVRWEVTYNSKYGQPGPLAYKLDTLVVNRRLDQLGRPLPEVIGIGSLSDVCRVLEIHTNGGNIADVKRAFLQNAFAGIRAKIRGRTRNGNETFFEIAYTRYSVVFTGETLPDGGKADAVYIILNAPYRELLNHVEVRPLDYDYLKQLPPGAQRFYELVSFQIYGAIAAGRPRAKMLYSDYCRYAPQNRYGDFDHVKKQMYKVHLPHRRSGYIAGIEFRRTVDNTGARTGAADWEMFYTPGSRAFAEHEAFTTLRPSRVTTGGQRKGGGQRASLPLDPAPVSTDPILLAELMTRDIAEKTARDLLANLKPGQQLMDQIAYVDFLISRDRRGRFDNPPGLLVSCIRDNVAPPAGFLTSRKERLQDEATQVRDAERASRAILQIRYDEYRSEAVSRFIAEKLPSGEYDQLFGQCRLRTRREFKFMTEAQIDDLTHGKVRAELEKSGRAPLVSFEEFCRGRMGLQALIETSEIRDGLDYVEAERQ